MIRHVEARIFVEALNILFLHFSPDVVVFVCLLVGMLVCLFACLFCFDSLFFSKTRILNVTKMFVTISRFTEPIYTPPARLC